MGVQAPLMLLCFSPRTARMLALSKSRSAPSQMLGKLGRAVCWISTCLTRSGWSVNTKGCEPPKLVNTGPNS